MGSPRVGSIAWVDHLITHGNSEIRASVHVVIDTGSSTVGEPAAYLTNNLAALYY